MVNHFLYRSSVGYRPCTRKVKPLLLALGTMQTLQRRQTL